MTVFGSNQSKKVRTHKQSLSSSIMFSKVFWPPVLLESFLSPIQCSMQSTLFHQEHLLNINTAFQGVLKDYLTSEEFQSEVEFLTILELSAIFNPYATLGENGWF